MFVSTNQIFRFTCLKKIVILSSYMTSSPSQFSRTYIGIVYLVENALFWCKIDQFCQRPSQPSTFSSYYEVQVAEFVNFKRRDSELSKVLNHRLHLQQHHLIIEIIKELMGDGEDAKLPRASG